MSCNFPGTTVGLRSPKKKIAMTINVREHEQERDEVEADRSRTGREPAPEDEVLGAGRLERCGEQADHVLAPSNVHRSDCSRPESILGLIDQQGDRGRDQRADERDR